MNDSQPVHDRSSATEPRRSFLAELGAIVVGVLILLCSLAAGSLVFLDPLVRRKEPPLRYREDGSAAGGAEGFVKVATLEMVPDDGVPRRLPVIANRFDAWNFLPDQPIGAVYVRRQPGEQAVQVFHATCPHAGCAVTFKPQANIYHCPCHNSAFGMDGEKVTVAGQENPSPRPMDTLEVNEQKLADGEVWIKFMDFYTGIAEKKPKI